MCSDRPANGLKTYDSLLLHSPGDSRRKMKLKCKDSRNTNTVYYKGAEIIRMMNLILGDAKFFKAVEYYFDKFDGTCATIQDFTTSMEESSKLDLTQFKNWYKHIPTKTKHKCKKKKKFWYFFL